MICIYSKSKAPRLNYILSFIFHDIFNVAYFNTHDLPEFISYAGAKINYDEEALVNCMHILPENLLFETGIQQQEINIFQYKDHPAFFKKDKGYPFDIFAASFYLLSRYEEYGEYEKDEYGRYPHKKSTAYRNNFLQLPLINIWLFDFAKNLIKLFPDLKFNKKTFQFIPTYDIDMAWSYQQKGIVRNIGGFIKQPTLNRIQVLGNKTKDPFDVYDELHELHKRLPFAPIYFFLVAQEPGKYDKNISPENKAMQELIKQHSIYKIGVHPSWNSFDHPEKIKSEKILLEQVSGNNINASRQHYIKMALPDTYRHLIKAGIKHDYSMGYGSINGFRASVASSFLWYDLLQEQQTELRIHPFCFMDANSFFEQHQSSENSYTELISYYEICKKYDGELITIFHNNILGTDSPFKGWKEMYWTFTSQLQQ